MCDPPRHADAPLSETIVNVFGCVRVGDSYFLREDMAQKCYTAEHNRAYKAGIFWMLLYPAGVPAFFLASACERLCRAVQAAG